MSGDARANLARMLPAQAAEIFQDLQRMRI